MEWLWKNEPVLATEIEKHPKVEFHQIEELQLLVKAGVLCR